MADIISWVATIATIVAASMTAANLGSRITGYGFCVFLAGSIAWLYMKTRSEAAVPKAVGGPIPPNEATIR